MEICGQDLDECFLSIFHKVFLKSILMLFLFLQLFCAVLFMCIGNMSFIIGTVHKLMWSYGSAKWTEFNLCLLHTCVALVGPELDIST